MKHRLVNVIAIVCAAVLTAPLGNSADGQASHGARIQRAMNALVGAGAPGVIVLFHDGDQVIRLAAGYGELATRTPIRITDRFRIASLTKTFVSVVVLQLVGEGKLSLNDAVHSRLPGLVPNGRNITIRQLLNHTSGLFDYIEDQNVFRRLVNNPLRVWSPQELIAVGTSHAALFAPGRGWAYSNTGYLLLGLTVEKATGNSLGAELRQRIFVPLGLRGTTFPATPQIVGPHAHGYFVIGKPPAQDVTAVTPSFVWANGAIVSTADDVAAFYRALLAGKLLAPTMLQAMRRPCRPGMVGDTGWD
jgi:D-alanyl-D-alanine carboxypeptidase